MAYGTEGKLKPILEDRKMFWKRLDLEERIYVALGLLMGVPVLITIVIFAWMLMFAMVGILLGQPVPDGAGAFPIRIVE